MTQQDSWREQQIKEKGLSLQMKAEANLEKQKHDRFVDVEDTQTGETRQMKSRVADIMRTKGKVMTRKMVFSIPSIPGFND